MPLDLPADASATLEAYEPTHYYAVWQHPEGRYAYSIDEERDGWLIALASRDVGEAYLLSDAHLNRRPPSRYRLDALTLPDAFAIARAQSVPFISSQGFYVVRVLGVVLVSDDQGEGPSIRHIPL